MATQVSSGPNQSLQAVIQGSFDVSEQALKLLLGSTPESPTPSGPPKFEASIKRAVQPTS